VQDALDALLRIKKRTSTIVIAHRLSTIKSADVIVVLDKGGKVFEETGTVPAVSSALAPWRSPRPAGARSERDSRRIMSPEVPASRLALARERAEGRHRFRTRRS
jgi:hypothetical protein